MSNQNTCPIEKAAVKSCPMLYNVFAVCRSTGACSSKTAVSGIDGAQALAEALWVPGLDIVIQPDPLAYIRKIHPHLLRCSSQSAA